MTQRVCFRTTNLWLSALAVASAMVLAGCGASQAELSAAAAHGGEGVSGGNFADMAPAPRAASAPQMAQASPADGARVQMRSDPAADSPPQTSTDAVSPNAPLLIYTAELFLAVYEVAETQEVVLAAIVELDGFLAQRSDNHLVVRVPAARFDEALAAVEGAGDVVSRNVQATDVSEEFRDLSIRIRNAEAMRERLEQLLDRAANVEEALSIERELQRLTETIETMKGRQRFLSDRIAFSTITIRFRSRVRDQGPSDEFELPFDWLDELGLGRLLDL